MQEERVDIHNVARQLELREKRILENKKIILCNKKHIGEFLEYMRASRLQKATLRKDLFSLNFIGEHFNKDFLKAEKNDIVKLCAKIEEQSWSSATKRAHLVALKKFYKWLRGVDEKHVYPPEVRWITTSEKHAAEKLPEELISEEEFEAMANAAKHPRDKAFALLLYESGARIAELLNVKIKHVVFTHFGAYLMLNGKTGMRRVPIVASAPVLATFLDVHPNKNNPDSFLFVTNMNRRICGSAPLTYRGASKVLKELAKKAGIKKRVYPHLFRHSSATRAAKFLTEAQMKEFFGWTRGSNMASVYVHLSGRDIEDAVKKMHGLEAVEERQVKSSVKRCARCKQNNGPGSKFCNACGLAVDVKSALELEDKKEKWDKNMDALSEDKEVLAFLLRRMKEKGLLTA